MKHDILTSTATNGKSPIFYDPIQTFDDVLIPLKSLLEDGATVLETLDFGDSNSSSEQESSDDESNTIARLPDDRVESFLRAISNQTKLLMEICPSLEQAYSHFNKPKMALQSAAPMFHVSEAAHHYVRKVYDRFPAGDIRLIERLGEANWQRHQNLRIENEDVTLRQDVGPHSQSIPKSLFRPASTFRDSALGASLPATSSFAPSVASHTSFASSTTASSQGRPRVPKTPRAVANGESFECQVCHSTLSNIRTRIDWK